MSANSIDSTFDAWALAVDALCRRHFCSSWADLCGEDEPLRNAYVSAETPMQFVERFGEKYDLAWAISPLPGLR
jgi:hypothetical protein